ncbi:MAG: ribonuclease H-like domain-containing protein, partial [Acidobacteria bacterium]|nr:ribonuclease H-like domain-containing protein [Acidobacteriota bacterium]
TETTGLSGGAGTYIFMTGLARFSAAGDELIVRQYLLPDPAVEPDFLERIRTELTAGEAIVCFNGKSYDLPLLQTRFLLNGFPPLPEELPVIDLLHPARVLWKTRLDRCDLQSLEEHVLGYLRPDDLPGALAPERYFRYLRRRDPTLLEDVYRHNQDDMLAMAALAAAMNRWLAFDHPAEDEALACLVRYLDTHGRLAEFEQMLAEHAERLAHYAHGHAVIGYALANLYKRLGRRAEAYELFDHLTVTRPREVPAAMEEVLIYEEHHLRDIRRALARCEEYLTLMAAWPNAGDWRERLEYRRRRLQRKLDRNEPPADEE